MNKKIILIMGIFVMVGLVYALATITITGGHLRVSSLQKGLVGHWMLDSEGYNSNTERITDKTPYENHGTNYGATLTTDRMGQSNRAMYFDGEDDYVDCGDPVDGSLDFGTGDFAVGAWIKTTGGHHTIVAKARGGANANEWTFEVNADGKLYFRLQEPGFQIATGDTPVNDGEWHHVVAMRDGINLYVYLDGSQDGSGTNNQVSMSNQRTFKIGAYRSDEGLFNGSISDVRIYNRALSADEIDTLYHSYRPKASSGSLQKGLVLDMPLNSKYTKDETVGSEILTDRTPYSNDGQNYGATVGSSYTDFDGDNDYVGVPPTQIFAQQKMTISAWINANNFTQWKGLIYINQQNGNDYLVIRCKGDGLQLLIEENNVEKVSMSTAALSISEWIHVAFTQDGTGWKFYLNGELATFTGTNSAYCTDHLTAIIQAWIGRSYWSEYYFDGIIDDVRIYNRALSSSEIKLLYDKGR